MNNREAQLQQNKNASAVGSNGNQKIANNQSSPRQHPSLQDRSSSPYIMNMPGMGQQRGRYSDPTHQDDVDQHDKSHADDNMFSGAQRATTGGIGSVFASGKKDNELKYLHKNMMQQQHPALGAMQLGELEGKALERDPHGQPLSPTHLLTSNKPFPIMESGEAGVAKPGQNARRDQHVHVQNDSSEFTLSKGQTTVASRQPLHQSNMVKGDGRLRDGSIERGIIGSKSDDKQAKQLTIKEQVAQENLQQQLNGAPKLAGLTYLDYAFDGELRYHAAEAKSRHVDLAIVERYQRIFHRGDEPKHMATSQDGMERSGRVSIRTDKRVFALEDPMNYQKQPQQKPGQLKVEEAVDPVRHDLRQAQNKRIMLEVQINLPIQTLLESVELRLDGDKYELFKKYLRISGLTRSSVIQASQIERDNSIGQDIQMTFLSPQAQKGEDKEEKKRLKATKFFKLRSGFLDESKKMAEFQLAGAVCQQLNMLFELDVDRVLEDVKQRQMPDELAQQAERRGSPRANSQYSSLGGDHTDVYDAEGSDVDDLDNEVRNISKQHRIKKEFGGGEQQVDHEDIVLEIDCDEDKIREASKARKQMHGGGRVSAEERRIFEGSDMHVWARRLLQKTLTQVKLTGFNMSKIPAITNLAHLMNTSFYLRKERVHYEDALEVDYMLGTLLISSKRNTQAVELLRNKVQAPYLRQVEHNIAQVQGKSETSSILSNDSKQNLKVQIKKLLTRAALIELMCAEAMCFRPQLSEKLQALVRMTQLCRGNPVPPMSFGKQIFLADDEYTTMVRILPFMLKFSIQCIEYNINYSREIVMVSALRNIQFILETQGCSLDSAMIVILKSILKNYPDKAKQERILRKQREYKKRHGRGGDQSAQNQASGGASAHAGLGGTASHTPKTLLQESKRIGGIHGTSSANELSLLRNMNGFNSVREMQNQPPGYHFNQNSARGSSNNREQLRLDESKNLQSELNKIFRIDKMTMIESIFSLSWVKERHEPSVKKEPNSGFEKTLMNLFNMLLDTYISVLSSISSHILHQIFYEVIVPCLTNLPFEEDKARYEAMDRDERQIFFEFSAEIKIYAVKIAEKIITICQGDLIINKTLLDTLVKASGTQSYKKQLEATGAAEQLRGQMKALWASIRTKVFTNYSMKGLKSLAEWLAKKLQQLAQNCSILDGKSSASDIAMLEISEEDMQQLCQYLEIVTYISAGRRNPQDEANSLIRIKYDYCLDLYLFLNPLLFWLDFSVERVERLNLFKQVYKTIKEVLESLPPKKNDFDIFNIISPFLQRTSAYLQDNSPTQSMLKFMDIVLADLIAGKYCQGKPGIQEVFLDQLNSIVSHLSFSMHEEIFPVFDKLLQITSDVMDVYTLKKAIMALVDANTQKQQYAQGRSKAHKQTLQLFMKSLLDSNTQAIAVVEQTLPHDLSKDAMNALAEADIDSARLMPRERFEGGDSERTGTEIEERRAPDAGPHYIIKKNTFYEVMLEYCLFENEDQEARIAAQVLQQEPASTRQHRVDDSAIRYNEHLQFRTPQELHEIHIERLQFFMDSLSLLSERHVPQVLSLIRSRQFKETLLNLLSRGEVQLRLKCHEILEIVGQYFTQYIAKKQVYEVLSSNVQLSPETLRQRGFTRNASTGLYEQPVHASGQMLKEPQSELIEVDVITSERLLLAQLMIQCVRKSFDRVESGSNDAYLQFNSLILLDYLFQNILPVASYQCERMKERAWKAGSDAASRRNNSMHYRGEAMSGADSQLEDGSSGGEGTGHTARRPAAAREIAERALNPSYIGDFEDALDLETLNVNGAMLEVREAQYSAMRLKLVLRLWPQVQEALNSPWSNIRSICYGLICSMLKLDVRSCQRFLPHPQAHLAANSRSNGGVDIDQLAQRTRLASGGDQQLSDEEQRRIREFDEVDKSQLESNKFYQKLRHYVIPMMINLLSSKESESKAGGLNILGSICGLSYDFSRVKISRSLDFFVRNSEFISYPIWQHVFELQDDWDITIKEASIVLIQLCAPREAIQYFNKVKIDRDNQKFVQLNNKMCRNINKQGGHGSLSNLSSARQNSIYNYHMNSMGSLNGFYKAMNQDGSAANNGGDQSSRRIDYKQVDFGYKNQHIPNVKPGGLLVNEFGKVDMATFLNDNADMMNLNVDEREMPSQPRKSSGVGSKKGDAKLALDLNKIQQQNEAVAAFHHQSLSNRSLQQFGQTLHVQSGNTLLLLNLQQQNTNLAQAIHNNENARSAASLNAHHQATAAMASQPAIPYTPFDFFVDEYSDQQIQEIISIFRNEFKPPNNLWIEKAAESSLFNGPDIYQEIFSKEIEQFNQHQMMLQQKQHEDLQAQVSSGSSLSARNGSEAPGATDMVDVGVIGGASTSNDAAASVGQGLGVSQQSVQLAPPVLDNVVPLDPTASNSAKKKDDSQFQEKNAQNANAVQQKIFENLSSDLLKDQVLSPERDLKDTQESQHQLQRQDRRMKLDDLQVGEQGEQPLSEDGLNERESSLEESAEDSQRMMDDSQEHHLDPTRALVEQINFDDINIGLEDINQSKQKCEEIVNSSHSDIIGESYDLTSGTQAREEDDYGNLPDIQQVLKEQLAGEAALGSRPGAIVIENDDIQIISNQHDMKDDLVPQHGKTMPLPSNAPDMQPFKMDSAAVGPPVQDHSKNFCMQDVLDLDLHNLANDEMAALAMKLSYQTSSFSDSQGKYPLGTSGSKQSDAALGSDEKGQEGPAGREELSQEEALQIKQEKYKPPELQVIESQSNELSSQGAVSGSERDSRQVPTHLKPGSSRPSERQPSDRGVEEVKQLSHHARSKRAIKTQASDLQIACDDHQMDTEEMEPQMQGADMDLVNFDGLDEVMHNEEDDGDDSSVVMIEDDVHELIMGHLHDNVKVVDDELIGDAEPDDNEEDDEDIDDMGLQAEDGDQLVLEAAFEQDFPGRFDISDVAPGRRRKKKLGASKKAQLRKSSVNKVAKQKDPKKLQQQPSGSLRLKVLNSSGTTILDQSALRASSSGVAEAIFPQQSQNVSGQHVLKEQNFVGGAVLPKHLTAGKANKPTAKTQVLDMSQYRSGGPLMGAANFESLHFSEENVSQVAQRAGAASSSGAQQASLLLHSSADLSNSLTLPQQPVASMPSNQAGGVSTVSNTSASGVGLKQTRAAGATLGAAEDDFNTKLAKSSANTNSTPDFKSALCKMAHSKSSQRRRDKQVPYFLAQALSGGKGGQQVAGSSTSTGAPLPPMATGVNYGNFSHRQVQATGLSGSAASGGKVTTKKEILKNLRKLKTNAGVEDYYVMQNISNQMGGKLVSGGSGTKAENFLSITNPLHVVNMNQTTSGLNTTKHNKTEKSFENLMTAFTTKKGVNAPNPFKGPSSSNQIVTLKSQNNASQSGKQHSHDSKGWLAKNLATTELSAHRNMSVASGGTAGTGGRQQKNLSNSPKARVSHNQEIKRLLSSAIGGGQAGHGASGGGGSTISQKVGRGQKSSQGKQSTALSFSGQPVHKAQAKTHRGGVPAGYTNLVGTYQSQGATGSSHGMVTSHNYQKPLIPNASKRQENMKDLNYLIKTMEKFSKKKANAQQHGSVTNVESGSGQPGQQPSRPQIITGSGVPTSDPQTPKDILMNLAGQMMEGGASRQAGASQGAVPGPVGAATAAGPRSFSNSGGQSGSRKVSKHKYASLLQQQMASNVQTVNIKNQKSKSTVAAPGAAQPGHKTQQMYEAMKQLQASEHANKKSGVSFKLAQFNALLSAAAQPAERATGQTGDRQRIGSSGGSRSHGRSGTGNTRGMFDLTPDSNAGNKRHHNAGPQVKASKSSGSGGHGNQRSSYSPPQSKQKMFENLSLGKHLLKKVNGDHPSLRNEAPVIVSQRDARSVDSKGRSCSTNKSGRGGSNSMRPSKSQQSQNPKPAHHTKKKMSFNLSSNQHPPQLNNLMLMNYSQTQQLDLREMNRQLNMMNAKSNGGGGSTQHKGNHYNELGIQLPGSGTVNVDRRAGTGGVGGFSGSGLYQLNSQRDARARDRSTSSNNSKGRGGKTGVSLNKTILNPKVGNQMMLNLLQANKLAAKGGAKAGTPGGQGPSITQSQAMPFHTAANLSKAARHSSPRTATNIEQFNNMMKNLNTKQASLAASKQTSTAHKQIMGPQSARVGNNVSSNQQKYI